jgi:hypothetical protein
MNGRPAGRNASTALRPRDSIKARGKVSLIFLNIFIKVNLEMESKIIDAKRDGAKLNSGRRGLMRSAGLGVAGVAALGAAGATGMGGLMASSQSALADTSSDDAILNFALNLEYLEANFYLFAAFGHGLPAAMTTGSTPAGGVTGGSKVPFKLPILAQYAQNIASDELAHVNFLRATLGAAKVGQPEINLQSSFTTLAVAAGLIKQGQTFNPFADEESFFIGAYIFEDVGVTAYLGALASITNPAYITAAGGIMAVEGYHAATIRARLTDAHAARAAQAISNLRATLSGAADDEGIKTPDGKVNIAPTDSNGLAFARTTRPVLNIVYGAQNVNSGLFFPNGIATTA